MNINRSTTMHIKDMRRDGYMRLDYEPELRLLVEDAVRDWTGFCGLPEVVKPKIFPYEPDALVSGNGYEMKIEVGEGLDRKEDFHIRGTVGNTFLEQAQRSGYPEAVRFVESALRLPERIAPILNAFAEAAEVEFVIPGFAADVKACNPSLLLRFLHYFGDREPGEEIAVPHVDKGGFTLHLYESDEGVQRFTQDSVLENRRWVSLPVSHKETVILPAMRLQHRTEGWLKALCHRVVATETSAQVGRFSAVCFVDFSGTPYYDKAKHGRLQEMPAGFNYDLPFLQFKELFTE
jgi:isopenicillin N synthase-like dioxygenase